MTFLEARRVLCNLLADCVEAGASPQAVTWARLRTGNVGECDQVRRALETLGMRDVWAKMNKAEAPNG